MRILVIGAGRTGTRVIRQLLKHPKIQILTADPREALYAVEEGIIAQVDFTENLNPVNLDQIIHAAGPDLVLLAMPTEEMGLGKAPGVDILADALREEIAALADVPVIEVARSGR